VNFTNGADSCLSTLGTVCARAFRCVTY
jgi:hypothetical protein